MCSTFSGRSVVCAESPPLTDEKTVMVANPRILGETLFLNAQTFHGSLVIFSERSLQTASPPLPEHVVSKQSLLCI